MEINKNALSTSTLASFTTFDAPPHWKSVDCISDLHLSAAEPDTLAALELWLAATSADAVFILGDLFNLWVGDDVLLDPQNYELRVACVLGQAVATKPIHVMHGNRDFLLGPDFQQKTGTQALHDPTLLRFGSASFLLTHGDALCLGDVDYLAFRLMVRSASWQRNFLQKPLVERRALAEAMRRQSDAVQQRNSAGRNQAPPSASFADVDAMAAIDWLHAAESPVLVHGHTHRPARHPLGSGRTRWVLSDWHADGPVFRGDVLRLSADGSVKRLKVIPVEARI